MRTFKRLFLSHAQESKFPNTGAESLQYLVQRLQSYPKLTTGHVSVNGWDLEFVDSQALISCFDVVVVRRWNDFIAKNESPRIIDCGAHIGINVLHYKRMFPGSSVLAYEADRSICNVLRRNIRTNMVKEVDVVEAAVWIENGHRNFRKDGADGGRLVEDGSGDGGDCVIVPTVRLADVLKSRWVDFLKIDIEGAEDTVLADCRDSLYNVGQAVVECHLTFGNMRRLATVIDVLHESKFLVSVNSYGKWVDLAHRAASSRQSDVESDQYALVCAWRD